MYEIENFHYDIVVLDIGLPKVDGIEVLRRVRDKSIDLPILALTARAGASEILEILDAGADDHMVKTDAFKDCEDHLRYLSEKETNRGNQQAGDSEIVLLARLRSLIRRSQGTVIPEVQHGDIALDTVAKEVKILGKPIGLSPKEFDLLEYLMLNPNQYFSTSHLEEVLYGPNHYTESNTLQAFISHIRKALGDYSHHIQNQRGRGYRFYIEATPIAT